MLSITIIVEIIRYLPTADFFKKHIFICKRIAQDIYLKRFMCKRHLGIIDDFGLEIKYHPEARIS